MNICIICIGKLKERYWNEAVLEYSRRLSKYCSLNIEELKEVRLPENPSAAEEEIVKREEGKAILGRLKRGDHVIALAIKGRALTSEELAAKIGDLSMEGHKRLVFIIGGSLGLSDEVLQKADSCLSFSAMTFPHQMMRVILPEQIYRSFKILKGEPYHK